MIALTREEKIVIWFLSAVVLLGIGLNYSGKMRTRGESESFCEEELSQPQHSKKIDINTAETYELARLPGIGPVLAKRILEYRNAHGPFKDPDELSKVAGIGPKKLAAIKEHIIKE